jgi:hypothetical protein
VGLRTGPPQQLERLLASFFIGLGEPWRLVGDLLADLVAHQHARPLSRLVVINVSCAVGIPFTSCRRLPILRSFAVPGTTRIGFLKTRFSRPELRRTYDVCAIYKSALSCDVRPTTGGDSHGNDKSKRGGADRRRVARGQAYEAGCGKTRFKPLITVWLEVRALPGPPLFRNRIGSVRHFALLPTPRP